MVNNHFEYWHLASYLTCYARFIYYWLSIKTDWYVAMFKQAFAANLFAAWIAFKSFLSLPSLSEVEEKEQ